MNLVRQPRRFRAGGRPIVAGLAVAAFVIALFPAGASAARPVFTGTTSQDEAVRIRLDTRTGALSIRLSELLYPCSGGQSAFVSGLRVRSSLRSGRFSEPESTVVFEQEGPVRRAKVGVRGRLSGARITGSLSGEATLEDGRTCRGPRVTFSARTRAINLTG